MRWFVHEISPLDEQGSVALVARDLEDPSAPPSFSTRPDAASALQDLIDHGAEPSQLFVEPSLQDTARRLRIESRAFDDVMRGAVLLEVAEQAQRSQLPGLERSALTEVSSELAFVGHLGLVARRFFREQPWQTLPPRGFSVHFGAEDKREGALVGIGEHGLFLFESPGIANAVLERRARGEAVDPSSFASLGVTAVEFYPPFTAALGRAFGEMALVPLFTCTSSLGDRRPPHKRELVSLCGAMWAACEAVASEAAYPFSDVELTMGDEQVACFFASVPPIISV